jgi:glutathione synthase/RimK-type ligase-like ATP-grasp enzyme
MAAELTPELAQLAERASAALELDYAGVDLMPLHVGSRSPQTAPAPRGGSNCAWGGPAHSCSPQGLQVIEVNGVAAWRGLQSVSRVDIAQCLVDDLLERRLGLRMAGPRAA